MEEIWKDIKGYEGLYEVSNYGKVRRLTSGRMRTPVSNTYGYYNIYLCKNGKQKYFSAAYLVISTFVRERPDGYHINHIDFNRKNNYVENLEYLTPSENSKYSWKHGRLAKITGENHRSNKLSIKDVIQIRKDKLSGQSTLFISKKFKVSNTNIKLICRRKIWKHVVDIAS